MRPGHTDYIWGIPYEICIADWLLTLELGLVNTGNRVDTWLTTVYLRTHLVDILQTINSWPQRWIQGSKK